MCCVCDTLMSPCPLKARCIHHASQENELKAELQMEKSSLLIKKYLNSSLDSDCNDTFFSSDDADCRV